MPGFRMPTHVHIAAGARLELPAVLRSRGASKVLLVQDPGLAACDWASEVEASLRAASFAVEKTTEVSASVASERSGVASRPRRAGRR